MLYLFKRFQTRFPNHKFYNPDDIDLDAFLATNAHTQNFKTPLNNNSSHIINTINDNNNTKININITNQMLDDKKDKLDESSVPIDDTVNKDEETMST
jgi:hypothetical protein